MTIQEEIDEMFLVIEFMQSNAEEVLHAPGQEWIEGVGGQEYKYGGSPRQTA